MVIEKDFFFLPLFETWYPVQNRYSEKTQFTDEKAQFMNGKTAYLSHRKHRPEMFFPAAYRRGLRSVTPARIILRTPIDRNP